MNSIKDSIETLLKSKGLNAQDIDEIIDFLADEWDKNYTIGYNVSTVQGINPFITTDDAISILYELDDMDCWETPYSYLRELVDNYDTPEAYTEALNNLFSTLLGNELYNLFLNYDEDFYFDFEWDNHSDIHFLAKLHAWCSNQSSFADELLRSARNYLEHKLNNNCLETIKGILKEVPPELITDEVITQLSKYLSFYSVSNIEITKLWKTLNK